LPACSAVTTSRFGQNIAASLNRKPKAAISATAAAARSSYCAISLIFTNTSMP